MAVVLYDQFGRAVERRKAPERRPLAVAPILDSWRQYVTAGLTPEKLAGVFKEADAGDVRRQAELFEQIEEKDGHLLGERSKRANVILDVDFELQPATEDRRDVKIAEFVEDFLSNRTDFPDVLVSLQDAVGKGYSVLEIQWDVSEGQALPEKLEFIEQKRFLFTDRTGILRRAPLLVTDDAPMGVEIPAWKVLFHRYGGKSGHPTRSGIFRVCTWMWLFKNYSIKDWVAFLEVFGMPLRLGKYDPGASDDDRKALEAAIRSLGSDAAGIISKNTEIDFVEAIKGRFSGSPYKELAEFCNRETSKAVLGQTLSAEVGEAGSYAAAKTHNDVRLDLVLADARALAATVRSQLIRPIVGFSFGWDAPVPRYAPLWEEEEDLDKLSQVVERLVKSGVEMPVSYIRQKFSIPEPEQGEPVVGGGTASATAAKHRVVAARAARFTPQQERIEGLVASALDRSNFALSGLLEPVKSMIAEARSLEQLRDRIIAAYGDMEPAALEDLLAQAMFVAELYGRLTVGK